MADWNFYWQDITLIYSSLLHRNMRNCLILLRRIIQLYPFNTQSVHRHSLIILCFTTFLSSDFERKNPKISILLKSVRSLKYCCAQWDLKIFLLKSQVVSEWQLVDRGQAEGGRTTFFWRTTAYQICQKWTLWVSNFDWDNFQNCNKNHQICQKWRLWKRAFAKLKVKDKQKLGRKKGHSVHRFG